MKDSIKCPDDQQLNRHSIAVLSQQLKRSQELIDELIPTYHRTKRGLFNFIGTFQKSLTGTLDAEDGERYEANFKNLFENQKTLKADMENHMSITKDLINQTNRTISSLIENQQIIVKQIEKFQQTVNENSMCNWPKTTTGTLLSLSEITNEVNDYLDGLLTAQTFARHAELHSNIIEPSQLQKELQEITEYLKDASLPIEPTIQNVPIYEKLIKVNTYQKGTIIYFVLKIPVVEKQLYEYYRLYPVPNEEYEIIIPDSKYVLLNKRTFTESNQPCQEIRNQEFLCENEVLKDINGKSCSIQLITHDKEQKCQINLVRYLNNQIIKIEESNSWIVTAPQQTTITEDCNPESTRRTEIKGNYLVTIPYGCKAKINSKILLPKNKEEFQPTPVNMPRLKINFNHKEGNPMVLNLTNIDLSQFSTLKQHISNLQQEVKSRNLLGLHDIKINWIQYAVPCILILSLTIITFYCIFKNKQKIIPMFQIKYHRKSRDNPEAKTDIPLGPF